MTSSCRTTGREISNLGIPGDALLEKLLGHVRSQRVPLSVEIQDRQQSSSQKEPCEFTQLGSQSEQPV